MRSNRLGAVALTATLLLMACGGGGGSNAASSSSTSSASSSSSSSGPSAEAKKAIEELDKAREVASTAGNAVLAKMDEDYAAQDLDALKADMRALRDVDFEFDKAIRAIDFPDEIAEERNEYFERNGDVIAAEDEAQAATTVLEFHQSDRAALRAGTKLLEARFALQRALGLPDPTDPGEPKDAPNAGGEVVFDDDFSDESSGWSSGINEGGTFSYEQGVYVLAVNDIARGGSVGSNTVLEGSKRDPKLESLDSVSISVTATKLQDVGGNMGLSCHEQTSPYSAYLAQIETVGDWSIGRSENNAYTELKDSKGQDSFGISSVINDDGEHEIRMDCVTEGDSVTVTLYVDGKRLGEGIDKDSPLPEGAVGLQANTGGQACCNRVAFDDIEIRDLS